MAPDWMKMASSWFMCFFDDAIFKTGLGSGKSLTESNIRVAAARQIEPDPVDKFHFLRVQFEFNGGQAFAKLFDL